MSMLTEGYKGGFIHYSSGGHYTNDRESIRAQYGQDVKYCRTEQGAKRWITKQRELQVSDWNETTATNHKINTATRSTR